MDFSKLDGNDRIALIAGLVVAVTGLISLVNDWGVFMILSLLAGLVAAFVVVQPQLAPQMKLPTPKGMTLLGAGVVATLASGLTAIDWLGWILDHVASFDTIQFVIGLVAAVVLLWVGWTAYSQGRGAMPAAPSAPSTPAA